MMGIPPKLLLAGFDNIYFSLDEEVSDATWERLREAQDDAKLLAQANKKGAHCPEWLDAQMHPTCARGGYRFLIERGDQFSLKLMRGIPNRPAMFIEMRSFGLHTHPDGVLGALHETFAYIGRVLFPELLAEEVMRRFNLDTAKCSRLDLHADWQGGDVPNFADTEALHFIHPGKVKVACMSEGRHCTGYTFGRSAVKARIYNKTVQAMQAKLDWYFEMLRQVHGEDFDESLDVWRCEFQLEREGVKGFRFYGTPEDTDDDDVLEAELAVEDLPSVSSVRQALKWASTMWGYLTSRWLRWVYPTDDANRARWPLRDSWEVIQEAGKRIVADGLLTDDKLSLVRAQRHSGYARGMHRMAVGLLTALETVDIDAGAAQARYVEHMGRIAHLARLAQDKRFDDCDDDERKALRILKGMGIRDERVGETSQLLDMAMGVFTSAGVLTLRDEDQMGEIADLLNGMADELDRVADEKGGIPEMLRDKWQRRFKVATAHRAFTKIA